MRDLYKPEQMRYQMQNCLPSSFGQAPDKKQQWDLPEEY